MDSFELNKIAGAVLGVLLFAFGTGFLAELIYEPKPAGKAGYDLPGGSAEGGGHGGGEKAEAKPEGVAALLAHADAEKGKSGTKACQGCHGFEEGGGKKTGPNLYGVVGRKKGGVADFDYSPGMKEKGGDWTFDDLDHFLTKPSAYIKGTKMSYQGISDAAERANVIAYLRSLSKDPVPLPAAEKKDEGAKAEGGKAEGGKAEGGKAEGEKKPADGAAKPPAEAKDGAKPAEGEKKPEEAKPADGAAKPPVEAKDGAKPAEGDKKAEEAKPADGAAKPPAEAKDGAKPAEGDKKAEEAKPADGAAKPPAEAKDGAKGDDKPPTDKPAEAKPPEDKPAQQ